MPGDTMEILDANIIAVLKTPLTRVSNIGTLFSGEEIAPLMRQPLDLSQGIVLDPAVGGAVGTNQVESMRSQKTVTFSPMRIEAHDRSGKEDLTETKLPELFSAVMRALEVDVQVVGSSIEASFRGQRPASAIIGEKVLLPNGPYVPEGMTLTGGSARLYLARGEPSTATYTLAIEPRGQDVKTSEIWMSCNAQVFISEVPSVEQLYELLNDCVRTLWDVKQRL